MSRVPGFTIPRPPAWVGYPSRVAPQAAKPRKNNEKQVEASTHSNLCVKAWILGNAAVHLKSGSTPQTTQAAQTYNSRISHDSCCLPLDKDHRIYTYTWRDGDSM